MKSMSTRITLWATNLGAGVRTLSAWIASVEEKLIAAKDIGSSLLVMPEYACAQWLSFAVGTARRDELAWLSEQARSSLAELSGLVRRHGVGLLAGTMPFRAVDGTFANRAVLLLSGGVFFQDKLALTPWERDVDGWLLTPGSVLRVIRWGGVRLAVAICLDVEVPELSARLCALDVDLLLVPSMTSSRAGYERVFGCAKARAIELMCPVAAVGAIGTLVLAEREEPNVSGAALFLPCEPGHEDGVASSIGPLDGDVGGGPLLHVNVPIEECRALRRGKAEVWPPRLPANLVVEDG